MQRALLVSVVFAVVLVGCARPPEPTCGWTQWAANAAHTGQACAAGQPLQKQLATFVFDPFEKDEQKEDHGFLTVHYQTPLLLGDDVYMLHKGGTYSPCPAATSEPEPNAPPCGNATWSSQTWNEAKFSWHAGTLRKDWEFASDWKPEPFELTFWEPVFQPALFQGWLYVPGANGTIHKIDRHTGKEVATLDPRSSFSDVPDLIRDPAFFVAGPLTINPKGDVYYNVLALNQTDPLDSERFGWLVKVAADDSVFAVSYQALVPNAPNDRSCVFGYSTATYARPFPPVDDEGVTVPTVTGYCGYQRPAVNTAVAVADDGTVYTVSRGWGERNAFIIAVNPNLTPKWSTSLSGLLKDGCGFTLPTDGVCPAVDGGENHLDHCCAGTTLGVDPFTNRMPDGRIDDQGTSSPVVLPDGNIIYGASSSYNGNRGHLMKFTATGQFLGAWEFGWDVTPAVYSHDSTYSLITKNNHYGFNYDVAVGGPYDITRLNSDLSVDWSFRSTNTQDCVRQADGTLACTEQRCSADGDGGTVCKPSNPNGFEWCVNAPAVDTNGVTYVNSEDGKVYAVNADGSLRDSVFLLEALGAAYTPIAVDAQGRVFTLNAGQMTVIGRE